jgi:hypothetical protein
MRRAKRKSACRSTTGWDHKTVERSRDTVALKQDDHVAIADHPSLQCGKAATCFMLNTKNTIIAIFVLVSLFTVGSETNALVDALTSSAVIATTHVRTHDQVKVRTHDDGDVAALELSEPSVKSPPLAKPSIHSSTFTGTIRSQRRAGSTRRALDEVERR